MVPAKHIPALRIKLNKFPVYEGIKPRDIRTHSEGRHLVRGQVKGIGPALHGAVKAQARAIQTELALPANFRGMLPPEGLIGRKHPHPNMATICKGRILYILLRFFPLQQHPITDKLRALALRTHGTKVVLFVHLHGITAGGAAHLIAAALHLMQGAALGAQVQQCVQVFGHLSLSAKSHLGLPVPDIVVVGQETVHSILHRLGGQVLQLLCGEHTIHRHLDPSHPSVQAVLGIGQIAAGNLGIVHRHPQHFQKLTRTDHHRLSHTRNRAHALGHKAQASPLLDDPAHLAHTVQVRGEIFLRNGLGPLEDQADGKTHELIVSHHKIQLPGIAGRAGKLIVHAAGMIADNDIGTAVLPGIGLKAKGGVDLTVQ